ncbi:MAG: glutamate racemase [Eubacteriales bacterium]
MMENYNPIGVFDSGLGGIGVLRQLVKELPNEDFIYLGDSKNAPYGVHGKEKVLELSLHCWEKLEAQGCKALVVACNSATSASIEVFRYRFPQVPMIGIEPALKPAVVQFDHPNVLVLATEITLFEKKFKTLMESYVDSAAIYTLPAPGIVPLVEQGKVSGAEMQAYLHSILDGFAHVKFDSMVLGCTHFPFVQQAISQVLGYEIAFFDGAEGTARETKRRLVEANLLNPQTQKGRVTLSNSSDDPDLLEICKKLLYI